jgi:hypothetical protein
MNEEIDHQQNKSDHEKQKESDNKFYKNRKPKRLVIKSRLQVKDQYTGN